MRIFTEQVLKAYAEKHPDSKVALQEWATIVKRSEWTCFADIKKTFNTVDNVGNQHYVFNIKGNTYRLVVVIKFTIKFVYIRFIGTHKEHRTGTAFQSCSRLLRRTFFFRRTDPCGCLETENVRTGTQSKISGQTDRRKSFTLQ